MVDIKPGDSSVLIGYQSDAFTCTWWMENFVAHSHIHPEFTAKMSTVTHFPLEPGCEEYSFLDQAVENAECGLDSIFTDSIITLELNASFSEPDVMTPSVS